MALECFRYEDLVSERDLAAVAGRAFGHEGLGIAVVTGVPGIAEARRELFTLGHRFATLPEETRARYEHPASLFSFGWSHGKETLEAGRPDLAKGSFYANPCFDSPFGEGKAAAAPRGGGGAGAGGETAAAEAVARYPAFAHPNVWPDSDVPGFSRAFKELGQAVVRVGELVARQCDSYIAGVHPGYEEGKMSRIISSSRCPKGRLLHYFPQNVPLESSSGAGARSGDAAVGGGTVAATTADNGGSTAGSGGGVEDDGAFSDWCGWHHDHSLLTGLVPAMFLDAKGREVANRDPRCGLYIRSRREGELVKATVPPGEPASSCVLFQIGETTQVLSGGALQATPHAVRSTSQEGVSRLTFAVFMQPEWGESMDVPRGAQLSSVRSLHSERLLPRAAAPIADRLRPGMDFGEFTEATFSAYY
eukprot:g6783.t1